MASSKDDQHRYEESGFCIRYGCFCGALAPVSDLFYSDQCHKLVCRSPRCSVQEFESYYCGFFLVNMPSKEASLYQNRSSRCFVCVCCENVLTTVFDDATSKFFLFCCHCKWDSASSLQLMEDDADTLVMSAIAREREGVHEDFFTTLCGFHSSRSSNLPGSSASSTASTGSSGVGSGPGSFGLGLGLLNPMASLGSMGSFRGISSMARTGSFQNFADSMKELQREQQMKKSRAQRQLEMGIWRIDQAHEQFKDKDKWFQSQRREYKWPELNAQMAKLAAGSVTSSNSEQESWRELQEAAQVTDLSNVTTLSQRLANPLEPTRDVHKLFPSRPLLRVKKTWRCVESIAKGSAGILVKPQISPMSGDSSMPIASSWFKKANLAVHYLPIFTFAQLPDSHTIDTSNPMQNVIADCILRVRNPVEDKLRIILKSRDSDGYAQILLDDPTPIVLGAFEDPNLLETVSEIDKSSSSTATATSNAGANTLVVQSIRNFVLLKIQLQFPAGARSVRFGFDVETEQVDDDTNEPIDNTLLKFPVEFQFPVGAE